METEFQVQGGQAKKQNDVRDIESDRIRGIISVYNTHPEAEEAVKTLQKSGFDMRKLSIVGRDFQTEEDVIGYYSAGDRVKYWGRVGAFWGGLWGLLFGSAFLLVPGVGPVVVAGTFASALVAALEGAVLVGGLSALGAALYSLGVSERAVVEYETAIKAGKFLMVAHGSPDEVEKAREIIKRLGGDRIHDFESNKEALHDNAIKEPSIH